MKAIKATKKPSQQFIEALQEEEARRSWELSKFTDTELRAEFNRRLEKELQATHYGHNVDITSEPFYCSDCEKEI